MLVYNTACLRMLAEGGSAGKENCIAEEQLSQWAMTQSVVLRGGMIAVLYRHHFHKLFPGATVDETAFESNRPVRHVHRGKGAKVCFGSRVHR